MRYMDQLVSLGKTIALSVVMLPLLDAATIPLTIDLELDSQYPDADLKRGYVLQGAVAQNHERYLYAIRKSHQIGNELIGIFRDINQFDHGVLFRSYRSRGEGYWGADGEQEEFYLENGNIQTHINSQFLEMCQLASERGMQAVFQLAGTPVEGLDDGSVRQLFTLDPGREYHGNARYYPIPLESEFGLLADTLYQWMFKLQEGIGRSDSIWLGTQEPEHTLGFPDGIKTSEFRHQNLTDYIKLWKTVSDRLHTAGMLTGGMQNNAGANSGQKFMDSVHALAAENCPIDFFSIQNYSGQFNQRIIDEAFLALDSNELFKDTKLLFHRYQPCEDIDECFETTAGIIKVLKAERILLDRSDRIYGYNFHTRAKGSELGESLLAFLNRMPSKRLNISGLLKNGLGGFAYINEDQSHISIALWNDSEEVIDTEIRLLNRGSLDLTVSAYRGEDIIFRTNDDIIYDRLSGSLLGIHFEPDQYHFVELRSTESKNIAHICSSEDGSNLVEVIPSEKLILADIVNLSCDYPLRDLSEVSFYDEHGSLLLGLEIEKSLLNILANNNARPVPFEGEVSSLILKFSSATVDIYLNEQWLASQAYDATGLQLGRVEFKADNLCFENLQNQLRFSTESLRKPIVPIEETKL